MTVLKSASVVAQPDDAITQLRQAGLGQHTGSAIGGPAKRGFDIMMALIAMVMFLPLFCLVAIAVKMSSRGSVFYGHKRVGHEGYEFKCWKFRTMVEDGDAVLATYFDDHPDELEEWTINRKLRNDPRVTRLGAVLRASSVDELPQIFNVLVGDMSIVGPRPVVQDELENYGAAAAHYLQARPGITGMWQVSGRSDVGYSERVSLDTAYITNWSFAKDIAIIARTIPAVISTKGSY